MKVEVRFTVDVDVDLNPSEGMEVTLTYKEIEAAVSQAVMNAMDYAQGNGHVHYLDDKISILMNGEVNSKVVPPPECGA